MPLNKFDGPIPGENYTTDTKNFPWHRPPEITDLDKAVEISMEKLTSEEGSIGILTMLEIGIPVSAIVEMFVMSGIGNGKWTTDTAILLAGPVSHIVCLMAKGYGIEYDLGIDQKKPVPTKAFFSEVKKINEKKAAKVSADVAGQLPMVQEEASEQQSGGFMSVSEDSEEMSEEY